MKKHKNFTRKGSLDLQSQRFRRIVKKTIVFWMKRQHSISRDDFKKIMEMLKDIQDSIEIMAREMAIQSRK